jgi:hypothetical protein
MVEHHVPRVDLEWIPWRQWGIRALWGISTSHFGPGHFPTIFQLFVHEFPIAYHFPSTDTDNDYKTSHS